jgi:prepilin-type N-terminal cleavage/methylation domain-containing protein
MPTAFQKSTKGFSLTELMVVMSILMTVIMVASSAFNSIMSNSSRQTKSVESQIEGIVGLELLRSDMLQAGFGLPWSYSSPLTFTECTAEAVNGDDPTTLNDGLTGLPPRAVLSINGDSTHGLNGSDYLTIKSTVVGTSTAAKKWTYLNYTSTGSRGKVWRGIDNLKNDDRLIVMRLSLLNNVVRKDLVVKSRFFTKAVVSAGLLSIPAEFAPQSSTDTYLVYGIDSDVDLSMPFNRADYYVDQPTDFAARHAMCAPGTGILYKSTVNQGDGQLNPQPLLNCVADMQVVYSLDTGSGVIDSHRDASFGTPGAQGPLPLADDLRNQLREIRVYIVAQDGKKDMAYTYPNPTLYVGEYGMGRELTISTVWKHYRWKVYTIIARPTNLTQN